MLRILQPSDQPALEKFLLSRLETSLFLLSNLRAAGLRDEGQVYQGRYAAAFDGEEIVSVVAHFWNDNLIVQAPSQLSALCRLAAHASGRAIKGVIGPDKQVRAAQAVLAQSPATIQLDSTEKLYALPLTQLILPAALRSGELLGRRIQADDLDLLTEWRIAYSIEALEETDGPHLHQQAREDVMRVWEERRSWLIEHQGQAVACSSFNAVIAEAVQIGGVWTPPKFRRRGYARASVAASLRDAQAEGVQQAILFTPEENLPAQKAYEAIGFREVGDYGLLLFKTGVAWP